MAAFGLAPMMVRVASPPTKRFIVGIDITP